MEAFYQQSQLPKFKILSISEQIFEPKPTREETIDEVLEENETLFDGFYNTLNYSHLTFHEEIDTTPWNWYTETPYIFFGEYSFNRLFQTHYHIPPVSEHNYSEDQEN